MYCESSKMNMDSRCVNFKNHMKYPQEKIWTRKIPTRKNFGHTESPPEKMLDPRNTHEKKSWTHEIPTRKNFGPTKYPLEKISDPRNNHEKKI